jgi:hypothetical protein
MSTVKPPKSIPPEQYPRKWWSYVDLPCPKHPPVDFHIHAITKSIQTPQKTTKTSHISRKNPQNHPIRTLPQKTAMLRSCPISKAPTREFSDRSEVKNLNRDIVDTYLHASRKSGTTWPNKGVFHTYGRKQNWNISNRCLYACFETFHSVFHPWMKDFSTLSGQMVFGLNAKSSLWMNTVCFLKKWTIP